MSGSKFPNKSRVGLLGMFTPPLGSAAATAAGGTVTNPAAELVRRPSPSGHIDLQPLSSDPRLAMDPTEVLRPPRSLSPLDLLADGAASQVVVAPWPTTPVPPPPNRLGAPSVEPDEIQQVSVAQLVVPGVFVSPPIEPAPFDLSHAQSDEITPALSWNTKITPDTDPHDALDVLKLRIDYFKNRHETDKIAFDDERTNQKDHPAHHSDEMKAQRAKIKKLSTRKSASKSAVIRDEARLQLYLAEVANMPSVEVMEARIKRVEDQINEEIRFNAQNPVTEQMAVHGRKLLMNQLINQLTKAREALRKLKAHQVGGAGNE
jgi:hypothetical protein